MEVKSKFNVGDVVYYIHPSFVPRIRRQPIAEVEIRIDHYGKSVWYHFKEGDNDKLREAIWSEGIEDNEVFGTLEELCEHLRKYYVDEYDIDGKPQGKEEKDE